MEETKSLFTSKKLPGGQSTLLIIQSKIRQINSINNLLNDFKIYIENNFISLKILLSIFSKNGIYLDSKEIEFISRRFMLPNGNISIIKLLKSIDIGIPSDYNDLDQFQNQLPQPYRMISKILELEIIDKAWLEILRKYPEVQEEIPGRNMIIRRNKNLDIECFPSTQSERSQNIAAMTGIGNLIFTVNISSSFNILDNETGKILHTLQLFPEEPQELEYLQYSIATSSNILPGLSACRVAVMKIKMLPKPPIEVETEESEKEKKLKAAAAANALKKAPTMKGKGSISVPPTEIEKKPVIPTHRCSVALIDVLGIPLLSSSGLSSSSSLQCNFVYSFDFNILDSQIFTEFSIDGRCLIISHSTNISFFKFPPINSSQELFGKKMGKILENEIDVIEENDTKQLQSSNLNNNNNNNNNLNSSNNGNGNSNNSNITEPQSEWIIPEIILKQSTYLEKIQLSKIFENINPETNISRTSSGSEKVGLPSLPTLPRITFCHLFSFNSDFQWDDTSISTTNTTTTTNTNSTNNPTSSNINNNNSNNNNRVPLKSRKDTSTSYHNGMIVFFEDIRRWFIFGLRLGPPLPPKQVIPVQTSPRGDTKKSQSPRIDSKKVSTTQSNQNDLNSFGNGNGNVVSEENVQEKVWYLDLLRQFPLSSSVTSITTDDKRSLLIIGQSDGLISLWDIKAMMLISIPTKHRSSITSICLTKGKSSYFLVSGDHDGILCFHKLHLAASISNEKSISTLSDNPGVNSHIKAELIDFRVDFTRDSIVKIWPMDGGGVSLVVVQIGSGKLVVYDADGAELLGRMSLTSGILGLKLEYTLSKREDCIISNQIITNQNQNQNQNQIIKTQYQQWNERIAIGTCCQNGFCGYFFRSNQSSVISSFSLDKLLSFYFPGISSLNKQTYNGKTLTSILLYYLLTSSQRMNSKITVASISLPSNLLENNNTNKNNENEKGSLSKSNSKRSLNSTQSTHQNLTAERLKELNQTNNFWNVTSLPSIVDYSSTRQVTSLKQFEKSCKISQIERFNRKTSVLNSLKQLSISLKEDR